MGSPTVDRILNFLAISDRLGTAGQPEASQFKELRDAGYEVVINLALPTSTRALPNEAELAAEQGLTYIHIPVEWEAPAANDLDRFFATMDKHQGRRVFAHCAMNMRVSCFVFLWRVIREGLAPEEALEAMHRIWKPNEVWHAFLASSLARYGRSDAT